MNNKPTFDFGEMNAEMQFDFSEMENEFNFDFNELGGPNLEDQKPDNLLQDFEDAVPVLGPLAGAVEGFGRMTAQFMGQGFSDIARLSGAIDQEAQDQMMQDPLLQPSTETGLWIQEKIGDVFAWYDEKSAKAISGIEESLHENNNAASRIAWTALETSRAAVPFLLPYTPKAVKYGMKKNKAGNRAKNIKNIRENRLAAEAEAKAYRENPANPLDFERVETPDVRVVREGIDTLSYKEFAELYKAENKTASTVETARAWEDYNSQSVRSVYTRLKDTTLFREEAQKNMQAAKGDFIAPEAFLKQGDSSMPPGLKDVGIMDYTPLTMTRAEFEGAYAARVNAGLGSKVRELRETKAARAKLDIKLQEAVKAGETGPLSVKMINDIKKEAKRLDNKHKGLERLINKIEQKLESPPTKRQLDYAYKKYINNRVPWEQRIAHEGWRDKYARAFDLRESDAGALKAFQEESAWRALEMESGKSRNTLLADRLVEAFNAKEANKPFPDLPAQRGEVRTWFTTATSPLDDLIRDRNKALERNAGKGGIDKIDQGGPPTGPSKLDNTHRTRTGISTELGGLYSKGMTKQQFAQGVMEKFPGLKGPIVDSIYDSLDKKAVNKTITTEEGKKTPSKLSASNARRGFWKTAAEAISGKAISMLFENAKYSPALRELTNKIWRTEIQNLKPGEVNAVTSYINAHRIKMNEYAIKLQDIYDALQLDIGSGWFVGFKNLVPQAAKGWGGQSLPKAINKQLLYAHNGKPLPGTHPAVLKAAEKMRQLENDIFNYLKESGLEVEYLENHSARMWISDKIRKNMKEFEETLRRRGYKEAEIEEIAVAITESGGIVDIPIRGGRIRMQEERMEHRAKRANNVEMNRKLHNLTVDDVLPFIETNLHKTMVSYIDQATRRGEFAKRFGVQEQIVDQLLIKAQEELKAQGKTLTYQEINRVFDILDALQGIYKLMPDEWMHKMIKWPISISNFALLQFATVASLPEIVLPVYQGGIKAYTKAMPRAVHAMAKDFLRENIYKGISKSELQQFAESIGKAGEVVTSERVMSMYGGSWASLDSFTFRANLLHDWTKFVNYVAVDTYRNQMRDVAKRWASGKPDKWDQHYEKLINYYGMNKQDVVAWYKKGMPANDPFFEKFKNGALTFAEDAILTSNPAIRPMWHSNPRLAWLAHLKGFPVMMGNTIVKRWGMDIIHEYAGKTSNTRNISMVVGTGMAMTMISMLSIMLQDYMKYGEGGNPKYDPNDMLSLVGRGIDRIGLYGAGGAIIDSMRYGDYKGFFQSAIAVPSFDVYNDAIQLGLGTLQWRSDRLANALDDYAAALLINLPRMGIGVDQDTKSIIKENLQFIFEDYLGMDPDQSLVERYKE